MKSVLAGIAAILFGFLIPTAESACSCVCQGLRAFAVCDDPTDLPPYCNSDRCLFSGGDVQRPITQNAQTTSGDGKSAPGIQWHIDNIRGQSSKPGSARPTKECNYSFDYDPKTKNVVKRRYCQ